MDNIVVDLDKLLNDFELTEEDASSSLLGSAVHQNGYPVDHGGGSIQTSQEPMPAQAAVTVPFQTNVRPHQIRTVDVPHEPPETLDLAEADFAPSPPKYNLAQNMLKSVEITGYSNGTVGLKEGAITHQDGLISPPVSLSPDYILPEMPVTNTLPAEDRDKVEKTMHQDHHTNIYTRNMPDAVKDTDVLEVMCVGSPEASVSSTNSQISLTSQTSQDINAAVDNDSVEFLCTYDHKPELIQSSTGGRVDNDKQRIDEIDCHSGSVSPEQTIHVVTSHPDVIPTTCGKVMEARYAACHETHSDSGMSTATSSDQGESPTAQTLQPSPQKQQIESAMDTVSSSVPEAMEENKMMENRVESLTQTEPVSESGQSIPPDNDRHQADPTQHMEPSVVEDSNVVDTDLGVSKREIQQPVSFDDLNDIEMSESEMKEFLNELEEDGYTHSGMTLAAVVVKEKTESSKECQLPTDTVGSDPQMQSDARDGSCGNVSDVSGRPMALVVTSQAVVMTETSGCIQTVDMKMDRTEQNQPGNLAGSDLKSDIVHSQRNENEVPVIVEKILTSTVNDPTISTPMDDPGFSKVPGMSPDSKPAMPVVAELSPVATPNVDDFMPDKMEIADLIDEVDGTGGGNTESVDLNVHLEGDRTIDATIVGDSVTTNDTAETTKDARNDTDIITDHSNGVTDSGPPGATAVSSPEQQNRDTMDDKETCAADTMVQKQVQNTGARPKDPAQMKRNRPNSLLGLSKPSLDPTPKVPVVGQASNRDSGFSESLDNGSSSSLKALAAVESAMDTEENSVSESLEETPTQQPVIENCHDKINWQLAQMNMMKSPLNKNLVNMEIKQQIQNEQKIVSGTPVLDNRLLEQHDSRKQLGSSPSPVPRVDDMPAEVCPETVLPGPEPNCMQVETSEITPVTVSPSTPSNQVVIPAALTGSPSPQSFILPKPNSHPSQLGQESKPTQSLELPTAHLNQPGVPLKQKRPTSLNLPPRSDFQPPAKRSPSKEMAEAEEAALKSQGTGTLPVDTGTEAPIIPVTVPVQEMGQPMGVPPNASTPESLSEESVGSIVTPPTNPSLNIMHSQLGKVAPKWLPDSEAANCMQCEARFTFTKRRHHCRACGKIFCSNCCSLKNRLQYMDNKEARVCSVCYQDLLRAETYARMNSPGRSPNPNNPSEYCSTIPPLQQANLYAPPPTVMVPVVGVLKREGSQRRGEPKQVMFSDGIRPGGDLTELDGSGEARIPPKRSGRTAKKVERPGVAVAIEPGQADALQKPQPAKTKTTKVTEGEHSQCLIPEQGLPPVILATGVKGDFSVEENPNIENILPQIKNTDDPTPTVFAVNKNLFVMVKIVNLDCCVNRVCWCFSTKGMCTVGQEELVIILECLPEEKALPRDIFLHMQYIYEEAGKGNKVSNLSYSLVNSQNFLNSRDHGGFLYVRSTFQCLQKLLLPAPPYVFGILLQKWEMPWAKVFPVRLMLRLGAEYRYYPCPLISVRFRKPVFGEIGHTIMNLLADFRKFQYMLPQIKGVTIHMEDKKTYINFPRNRYDDVMKVINNSNDHVMALAANFSMDADSHLVCTQNEDGNYQTQAINIQNKPRKVTGASFVVFNGALKSSSGLRAKSSIVEDGLMVQITAEAMVTLKQALRDMKDYTIGCGSLELPQPDEVVIVQWKEEDKNVNLGVKSPIDKMSMDGVESIVIHNATDYVGETRTIRWTEVFFIRNEDSDSRCEPVDLSRLAETLAQACCIALTPHLDKLKEAALTKIGLRVNIESERVGYEIGSNGEKLPNYYMKDLDDELIPVIHSAASHSHGSPVILELIFHVVE